MIVDKIEQIKSLQMQLAVSKAQCETMRHAFDSIVAEFARHADQIPFTLIEQARLTSELLEKLIPGAAVQSPTTEWLKEGLRALAEHETISPHMAAELKLLSTFVEHLAPGLQGL